MKYLVDTDILIYLCNSKSLSLEKKFRSHSPSEIGVSSITVAEMIYGAWKSLKKDKNLQAVVQILSPFQILDLDSNDAWVYGELRAQLEKIGRPISGNDLLIAAQARRWRLTVVTNNVKEYSRIEGLNVENWT